MENFLSDFVDWMSALPVLWAYAAILIVAYGENVVPPIPGDMIVVFGGYMAGLGRLDLWVVVLLATVGGALGFMSMYAIGYRIGRAVLDPHRLRWLPKRQIHRAQVWLQRWGYGVVLANRFLSGARSVISLTVGMARMRVWLTWVLATLSALIWTSLIAYAGYKVGENWEIVGQYLSNYGQVVVIVLGAALVLWGGWALVQRARTGEEVEQDGQGEESS